MFKKLTVIILALTLAGCASLQQMLDQIGSESGAETSSGSRGGSSASGAGGASSGNSAGSGAGGRTAATANRRGDPDAANWDIARLDTARDAEYLSAVEKDVVLEMNKVRTDPRKYAELYIQTTLRYYNGTMYQQPGKIAIQTNEGRRAVESCVTALSRMSGVGVLTPELGLSRATRDHAADQGQTGRTGHDGSDRSTPFTRITRYGDGYTTAGENIAYGPNTGRDIVVQLLIDDGVPSRGHRTNIMNRDFAQTGAAFGTHPQFRTMCVIVYAKGYVSK